MLLGPRYGKGFGAITVPGLINPPGGGGGNGKGNGGGKPGGGIGGGGPGGGSGGGGGGAPSDPFFSNVVLLLKVVSGSIVDVKGKTPTLIGTVPPVATSSQTLFGEQTIDFTGTGAGITFADSPDWQPTGSYTWEWWWYLNARTNDGGIVSQFVNNGDYGWTITQGAVSIGASNDHLRAVRSQTGGYTGTDSDTYTNGLSTLTGSFHHCAFQHNGTDGKAEYFINGDSQLGGAVLNGTSLTVASFFNSTSPITVANGTINGYLHSMRLTKGVRRYTGAYTPSQFPTQ